MTQAPIDIKKLIEEERVVSIFHPIVSVLKGSLVGIEALARGVNNEESLNDWISPYHMFTAANQQNMIVEFDRLCRRAALNAYCGTYSQSCLPPCQPLLFLNLDTTIIDKGVVGSGFLVNTVRELGLDPNRIVIEILESKVKDIEALQRFIKNYKAFGFLIALDDVGAGHSNLDRIHMIKPDIIKVDRGLIENIDKEFYKQEVFRSLANLSKRIGALVVAEGVETLEEAVQALELGADFLQGYYFTKPAVLEGMVVDQTREKMQLVAEAFRKNTIKKIRSKKVEYETYDFIIHQVIEELKKVSPSQFDIVLYNMAKMFLNLECMYILDESGMQVSSTVFCQRQPCENRGFVYQPAEKGADHSLKNYYLFLSSGQNKHITDSYISLASGNPCVTVSTAFVNQENQKYILCVDLYPQHS
ncbi:hypothetical protein BHU72_11015 [Desulfuribacillus stibiiarsenatis]|uniref:EAL domain-containing protein n=1 Tax=Desulfuribacillus stibiiarsenatis TaxID=1390249 RepID=A0A1E5L2E2_9FIRM|nr:EAL domain-containing protein [Desulfuribacillus stibiiarsenatis]OEH84328.1 hypothetical protein BHU72_11015 [Desulfuribacillus stibiiarsenatis]